MHKCSFLPRNPSFKCHTPLALPKDVLLQESLVEIGKVELNDGVLEQMMDQPGLAWPSLVLT